MAHSFANLLFHLVFSTKDRNGWIDEDLGLRLFPYLGGIVRDLDGMALTINGVADHVHLLVVLRPTIAVSDALRVVKTNSSRWVHEQWARRAGFAWQTGYGAFSVSQSQADGVQRYIANQEQHHRTMTFQEEFVALLKPSSHGWRRGLSSVAPPGL